MSRVGLEAAGSCSRLPTSTPEGGLPATTASFEATDALKHPPRQTRRCRRRFRTTTTGQAGTPSVGSTRASRPGLARPRLLFTCGVSPRTLVARAEPYRRLPGPKPLRVAPPASSKVGGVDSNCLALRLARHVVADTSDRVSGEKDASHRLLQPTLFPSTNGLSASRCTFVPRNALRRAVTRVRLTVAEAREKRLGASCRLPNEPSRWSLA